MGSFARDAQATCFVAGIVKGLVEGNGATHHFGSTAGFSIHFSDAVKLGLVTADRQVTDAGRRYYDRIGLAAMPNTRAYMWPRTVWEVAPEDSDNG